MPHTADHYAGYSGYGYVGVGVGVGTGGAGVGVVGTGIGPMYPYTVYSNDYEVGTLVIDLLDHSKKADRLAGCCIRKNRS